ncbi:hypothetical protein [Castellaniella sp.]|uniref:hypothetical protein n=1 Tax=Castellaniella sp. TaxID=1955812 RepID=UPI002B0012CC|nr:hypothetical protein [Castellaniella sp.]
MKTVIDVLWRWMWCSWRWACLGGCWWAPLSLAQPAAVPAVPVPPSVESWETQSVRELMQQDLREALRAGPSASSGRVADHQARPLLAPRLVALYGVGQALMAEVQVGQRAYLYVRGQAFPAGYAQDPGVYQLRGMNGACVQLERGEDRHSLCLRMLLSEERP